MLGWGSNLLIGGCHLLLLYEFSVLFAYAKVMELIDPQQGWWNLDMLYSIFNDVDVQAISQIPISLHGYEDRLI